jgi:hypothetical protein
MNPLVIIAVLLIASWPVEYASQTGRIRDIMVIRNSTFFAPAVAISPADAK